MAITVERKKWILYKHTCDYELIKAVALDVKNTCKTYLSDAERHRMQERLAKLNLYKTRNPAETPLDSINHRINTLEYWMFGYEYKDRDQKRFMFSPLGNLFLKYIDDNERLCMIFISMLFALQFQHPASGTDKEFQLYPFRLIFKLLFDERLGGKLYNNEVEYLVVFIKNMSSKEYEKLVVEILNLREKTDLEMSTLFKKDEHTYVNAVYEWEYYTLSLLSEVGVFEKHLGHKICELFHPRKEKSKSPPTKRIATRGYITIPTAQAEFISDMITSYHYDASPITLNDAERMTEDAIKEIYSFYPKLLLDGIGETSRLSELLELPKHIGEYAINPENNAPYLFERVLTDGFNMFYNVDATQKGGAGHTDIECFYRTKKKKFAVESKSTANKLTEINVGRLREHREEIGGEYTIVVTPRYVPAAKRDIVGAPVVIILASTFAEYLYNHIFNEIRDVDYADFDDIIINNLGQDISLLISDLTIKKFSAVG